MMLHMEQTYSSVKLTNPVRSSSVPVILQPCLTKQKKLKLKLTWKVRYSLVVDCVRYAHFDFW